MSLNNSYNMYGSQRGSNPLDFDRMQQQSGQQGSGVQLDLSHLARQPNNGQINNMGQNSNVLLQQQQQTQAQLFNARQQQINVTSVQALPQQQQQPQTSGKKAKESMLKTPLSLLNELCAKAKTTPIFGLEETGPIHSRVYNCTVKVDTQGFSCEATATGKTKKDAKQEAAKLLLLQMDNEAEKYLLPKPVKEEPVAPIVEVDPDVPGNPVGDLNDLCTKLKRLPPEYEDVAEFGKPHERVYTVACKLGSHILETGRGRSKKTAKKAAAHRVHKRVLEILTKDANGAAVLKDEDNLIDALSSLALVSKEEAKKINDGWKLSDWIGDLRNRPGAKMESAKRDVSQSRLLNPDPIKLLKEIAEEQKFKLEFMELDPGTNNDLKTYLIAVSAGNQPITVLMGSAESKTQAKKVAAENFLDMLRAILVSK